MFCYPLNWLNKFVSNNEKNDTPYSITSIIRVRYKHNKVHATLDNLKLTGPSINFERSRVRVFKSPEIFGLIIGFKFTITGSLGLSSFYTGVY